MDERNDGFVQDRLHSCFLLFQNVCGHTLEQGAFRTRVAATARRSRRIAILVSFLPKLRQPFALLHYLGFATALYSGDFLSLGVASDLQ